MRRWALAGATALAVALAAPGAASAHAYLIRTTPTASGVLNTPPPDVALTYDEAVEPRFAIISVTNAAGQSQTVGPVRRSPANPTTLVVPLRPHLPEGWYLIYWRAISVDGHPVQGAFTYAVGPNPGPAPQFPVPSVSATSTSANLLIARWVMFVAAMSAIGLFAFRMLIARPVVRRVPGASLRPVSIAFVAASLVALVSIPVYLDFSTANDSLRSVFDLSALVPLYRVTAFGRAYADMALCFALFCVAAWMSLWLDRPQRTTRSIAELTATAGALLAGAAVLVIPGTAGHASTTSPRGLSVPLDWAHLIAGSVWLGGLIGLLVVWFGAGRARRVATLSVVVPRFSNVALLAVVALLATGTAATVVHMPVVNALWDTGYGQAILVKLGILGATLALAAGNRFRTTPRLAAAGAPPNPGPPTPAPATPGPATPDPAAPDSAAPAERAAGLLRGLLSGEAALIAGAVFAASVLSSLAPPPPAFALQNSALARVGPGRVAETVRRAGYVLEVLVSPNKAAAPDSFALRITKGGIPVRGATVTLALNHLEMQMPQQQYQLTETQPGVYARSAPALIMVGRWGLTFQIAPPGAPSFTALIVDQANG